MSIDPSIQDLFTQAGRPLLSFEFFPPKTPEGMETLRDNARELRALNPDFVTVTYGAGGSTRQKTFDVCAMLRDLDFAPVMPHLTCVGSSRDDLAGIADEIFDAGYRNIMTLRGDPPKGDTEFRPAPDGLAYASDLVTLLRERHAEFCCGVGAYPEVHPEADSAEADLSFLKTKLDAGGAFATTQLFFDNDLFFRFVDQARAIGITAPILPGLLPALSLNQVKKMCTMCRAYLPPELEANLVKVEGDPDASREVGIEWAARQIEGLLERDVPGIHLYILNRAGTALAPRLRDVLHRVVA
jgi:methylenetetrahydrofolate reductase (NADPH)